MKGSVTGASLCIFSVSEHISLLLIIGLQSTFPTAIVADQNVTRVTLSAWPISGVHFHGEIVCDGATTCHKTIEPHDIARDTL